MKITTRNFTDKEIKAMNNDNETENEEVSFTESDEEKAQRIYLSEILRQLLQSERFCRFFECNFEVSTTVNEETQEFQVTLMELDPSIAQSKLENLLAKAKKEQSTKIVTATAEDARQLKLPYT